MDLLQMTIVLDVDDYLYDGDPLWLGGWSVDVRLVHLFGVVLEQAHS